MTNTINLNADLGESFGAWTMGEDEALLQVVRSANIACGFHAGDPVVMRHTVRTALAAGVSLGAHPAYPDLQGNCQQPECPRGFDSFRGQCVPPCEDGTQRDESGRCQPPGSGPAPRPSQMPKPRPMPQNDTVWITIGTVVSL